jgi:uncharacterized membrane protein
MEPLEPMNRIEQPHSPGVSWPRRVQSILIMVLGVALVIYLGFFSAPWPQKAGAVVVGVIVVVISEFVISRKTKQGR